VCGACKAKDTICLYGPHSTTESEYIHQRDVRQLASPFTTYPPSIFPTYLGAQYSGITQRNPALNSSMDFFQVENSFSNQESSGFFSASAYNYGYPMYEKPTTSQEPFEQTGSTTPTKPTTPDLIPFQDDYTTKSYDNLSFPTMDMWPTVSAFDELKESELEESEYTYAPIRSDQLRLLRLEKGKPDDPIHCSLKPVNSSKLYEKDIEAYQALSYAWGTDKANYKIFLQDEELQQEGRSPNTFYQLMKTQSKPRSYYIRSNLYQALKMLRLPSESLWFWIDALCINQKDDVEKSHQLENMLNIYSYAFNVCIWLGDTTKDPNPLDFIPSIVNLRTLDDMLNNSSFIDSRKGEITEKWKLFQDLFRRSWFRRRWVIQEIASARQASVQYGNKSVNWIDFADAVELFNTHSDHIVTLYGRLHSHMTTGSIFASDAGAIVRAGNKLLRKASNGAILDRPLNIETLVTEFIRFQVSEPRDIIYSLLSLASDGPLSKTGKESSASLIPDYTKPILQVYVDFIHHCVQSSQSLNVICRTWAPPARGASAIELPSWIGRTPVIQRIAVKESLVGDSPHQGPSVYNASRGRAPQVSFETPFNSGSFPGPRGSFAQKKYPTALKAKGIVLGKITRASSRIVSGNIPDECLLMLGWDPATGDVNKIDERLWRTLVAGCSSDKKTAPPWYRRACQYCLRQTKEDGDLNTSSLIDDTTLPATVIDYLKRVQKVVWNRKFFLCQPSSGTESESLVGIGSSAIKEGDTVCILFGCSVPVVLGKASTEEDWFLLRGESYIHGKMEGEALVGMDEETISTTTIEFTIR
jgi:hypothetical protein